MQFQGTNKAVLLSVMLGCCCQMNALWWKVVIWSDLLVNCYCMSNLVLCCCDAWVLLFLCFGMFVGLQTEHLCFYTNVVVMLSPIPHGCFVMEGCDLVLWSSQINWCCMFISEFVAGVYAAGVILLYASASVYAPGVCFCCCLLVKLCIRNGAWMIWSKFPAYPYASAAVCWSMLLLLSVVLAFI